MMNSTWVFSALKDSKVHTAFHSLFFFFAKTGDIATLLKKKKRSHLIVIIHGLGKLIKAQNEQVQWVNTLYVFNCVRCSFKTGQSSRLNSSLKILAM